MSENDTKTYSLAEIQALIAAGAFEPTRPDAPEMKLDAQFWENARVVMPGDSPKILISLRLDREVCDWFKGTGKGYLSRMNAVLRAYVEAQRDKPRP